MVIWLTLWLIFLLNPVSATDDFETSYQVRYQANPSGMAHVSQDISLTNKLSNIYATQYTLTFQSTEIENIQASDELGPLEMEINRTESTTSIVLKFNQQVVGKDKALNFNLAYDAPDLVGKTGQVWEITVPKLANSAQIDHYQLQLAIPYSFGAAAYISPPPITTREEENFRVYHFTKNQIARAGVSAAFGQFQVFDFIFNYHLQNENLTPVSTEIALPPDTAFQIVYYQSLEPKPDDVRVDEDGNWLASYSLSGNQKLNVEATGKVKIFSQPQKNFFLPSQETLEKNLQEQKYWSIKHPLVQDTASQLKSSKDIYQFVVSHLGYDFDRVKEGAERRGALGALGEPEKSICMEFTDLFITLARASGIPAREANGYAYTTNPKLQPLSLIADVLHSWPEYWDEEKKVWVPVDPTWEKTTGGVDYFDKTDLNHFVFAIHGLHSELPAPVGSYRAEENGKNIQVDFGKFENVSDTKIEVEFALPKTIFTGIKTRGEIIIHNLGPAAIYHLPTQISGENLGVSALSNEEIILIPPFGKQSIPVEIVSENWLKIGQANIKLSLDGQVFQQKLIIRSLIWQGILPAVGLIILLATVTFFLCKCLLRRIPSALTLRKRRVTNERE